MSTTEGLREDQAAVTGRGGESHDWARPKTAAALAAKV
uniref:Uncharacterized protein n=1 Tax=Arundo donax TaxID=35708 RepID=A0A0A8YG95_ARUDO